VPIVGENHNQFKPDRQLFFSEVETGPVFIVSLKCRQQVLAQRGKLVNACLGPNLNFFVRF